MSGERQLRFWLIGLALAVILIYLLRGVLLPFVAGAAIAYLFDPLCDRLEARGLSRTLATSIVTVAFLLLLVFVLLLLIPALISQVGKLVESLPGYIDALRGLIAGLLDRLRMLIEPQVIDDIKSALAGSSENVVSWVTSVLGGVLSSGVALANTVSLLVLTPIVAFYLLRDWDAAVAKIDRLLPREHADTIRDLARQVDRTLAGFLRGQAMVCLILGLFYAIGLSILGLNFGLVIGLVAGVLTIVPYVGATIGLLLSVGFALFQFDSLLQPAIAAAIFLFGQFVEGNFLTPRLVGGNVGLHPVWVIFALMAGGALFGFVGILLALPVAAVIGVGVRFAVSRYKESGYFLGRGEGDPGGSEP